ncbi:MAG: OmpH family outer membrane protein, partial [Gammaproteobacteria bacterium]|nr:OmpH family outer membrane protein [Gammaproteobacteria bacterium]
MLNIRKWVLAVFFASMSMQAMADAPVKLGVVNVALLLEQAPQAKDATANLEKEFAPQQAELKALATKLEKKQSDYQKDKVV